MMKTSELSPGKRQRLYALENGLPGKGEFWVEINNTHKIFKYKERPTPAQIAKDALKLDNITVVRYTVIEGE